MMCFFGICFCFFSAVVKSNMTRVLPKSNFKVHVFYLSISVALLYSYSAIVALKIKVLHTKHTVINYTAIRPAMLTQ